MLNKFLDPVYLHQTRLMTKNGIDRFADLPQAMQQHNPGQYIVHFHPPYYRPVGDIESTVDQLDSAFAKLAKKRSCHFEIETYSYAQLLEEKPQLTESIVREYEYVLSAG